jgi:hypothetical protein
MDPVIFDILPGSRPFPCIGCSAYVDFHRSRFTVFELSIRRACLTSFALRRSPWTMRLTVVQPQLSSVAAFSTQAFGGTIRILGPRQCLMISTDFPDFSLIQCSESSTQAHGRWVSKETEEGVLGHDQHCRWVFSRCVRVWSLAFLTVLPSPVHSGFPTGGDVLKRSPSCIPSNNVQSFVFLNSVVRFS